MLFGMVFVMRLYGKLSLPFRYLKTSVCLPQYTFMYSLCRVMLTLSSLSFLDQVSKAGECAQEYLELLHRLTSDPTNKWKSYLAMRGVLPQIGELIAAEIEHIGQLEDSTMSFNLSQGYALKMLTGEGCGQRVFFLTFFHLCIKLSYLMCFMLSI